MNINFLDIILVIPLLLFTYSGFKKGLIIEVATLAALILGLYFAFYFSEFATEILDNWFTIDPAYLAIIAFIVTFTVVMLLVIAIGKIIEKFMDLLLLGFFNKLTGAVFGLMKGALVISIVIFTINYFNESRTVLKKETCQQSTLYGPLESIAPTLYSWVQTTHFHFKIPEKQELIDPMY
ncbi:MAG: colicin V production protein [Bacteroidetes bacterium CG18_big_fil_WC_8_21_14_2_50_41_14]|nr:MAG: colicin V production protein [Bacteroidetes bacterium CG18_big_fil_WC_8_21_14_2_50_41_14]PIY30691.1 MAG: colicin V production protein [Bacteroidetes bacterium CG_4_10_14_3_um_filter_42_6]PJB58783.1 MAG: colicin V production protein [Bacteroidetes bacterium CG_4_9_14_3_um_filter_41_19]